MFDLLNVYMFHKFSDQQICWILEVETLSFSVLRRLSKRCTIQYTNRFYVKFKLAARGGFTADWLSKWATWHFLIQLESVTMRPARSWKLFLLTWRFSDTQLLVQGSIRCWSHPSRTSSTLPLHCRSVFIVPIRMECFLDFCSSCPSRYTAPS